MLNGLVKKSGLVGSADEITGGYFANLVEVLVEDGVNPAPLLAEASIDASPDALRGVARPGRQYLKLAELVLAQDKVNAPGLRAGRKLKFSDYGILGFAIWSSQNLRQSLDTLLKFAPVLGAELGIDEHYEVCGDHVAYKIACHLPPGRLNDFILELSAAEHIVIRELFDYPETEDFLRVNFSFKKPAHAELLEEALQCPVYFDQPETELLYPSSWLDLPFKTSNDLAARICAEQCEMILDSLERKGGFAAKIRRRILASPSAPPTFEQTASEFHLSTRTLRRRLADEGTSFLEILREVRMELAKQYLGETRLSIKEISGLLGFSEVANFQRAFKLWSGVTPSHYRNG